jgi:hypothetical protein
VQHLTKAIELDADNKMAYYLMGRPCIAQGDSDGAVAQYRESLKHWTQRNTKFSKRYTQEMQIYIDEVDKSKADQNSVG